MPDLRQHPRITDTQDLIAGLQAIGRPLKAGRVLNLSEGGMLVTGTTLGVGDVTGFELAGPGFRYAGVANVAHTTDGATGLQFICWRGQADRSVRALVTRRSHNADAGSLDRRPSSWRGVRRVAVFIGTDVSSDGPEVGPPAA